MLDLSCYKAHKETSNHLTEGSRFLNPENLNVAVRPMNAFKDETEKAGLCYSQQVEQLQSL